MCQKPVELDKLTLAEMKNHVRHCLVNITDEGGSHFKDFSRVALGFPTEHFFIRKLPFDKKQLFSQEFVHPGQILKMEQSKCFVVAVVVVCLFTECIFFGDVFLY